MTTLPPDTALLGNALERLWQTVRRGARRARVALHSRRIQLVFHPGYCFPKNDIADHQRASKILGHLVEEGWLAPTSVLTPRPASAHQLLRVHDAGYLADLDAPAGVARVFGVDELNEDMARSYVAAQRWATGGTVLAAQRAVRLRGRGGVVANLSGGFHHAHRNRGGGYCAFNDVAVALASLRAHGFSGRVLVIDLDLHHGDGNRRIFADDERVLCCSIHATSWDDTPAGNSMDVALGLAVGDRAYLKAIEEIVTEAYARAQPELVMYLAGVDVAQDDRLGSWLISAAGVMRRDQWVLEHAPHVPVVMLAAGGYGAEAWRYGARTLAWLLSGHDEPLRGSVERGLDRFRAIRHSLEPAQLSGEADPFALTDADIVGALNGHPGPRKVLGYYSSYGIELAFARYGLFEHLHARGYDRVEVKTTPGTGLGDRIQVFSVDDDAPVLLIELVAKVVRTLAPYSVLDLEWVLLQDPRATPQPERPLLPGQQYPGLGCLHLVIGMLVMACERLSLDGLLFTPAHYHVAAQARGVLRFFDPKDEAFFVAIGELTKPLPLSDATRLVHGGSIVDADSGEPISWRPARMVLPVSPRMQAALDADSYEQAAQQAASTLCLRRTDIASRSTD